MKISTCFPLLLLAALPATAQNSIQAALALGTPKAPALPDTIIYSPQGTLYNGLYRQSVGYFLGTPRNADGIEGTYVVGNDKVRTSLRFHRKSPW